MQPPMTQGAADPDEEKEAKGNANLTPLGKRTLAGYVTRWGEEVGEQKFQQALNAGTIDRAKMLKQPKSRATVAAGY